ncbi:uncharacterized protein LOC101845328 [Aplysia californica]|uniref:Uncharacterized protein LOC101845328 n=1 Tax=Aplysia californica TaxID=6500 RepID=A0ABM0JPX2_APLCA|nr:uncharacterized protein LOC101845328 [Aplysia californica]
MAQKQGHQQVSPRKSRYYHAKSSKRELQEKRAAVARRRAHATRHVVGRTGCNNPETRKSVGAVLIAVGVLFLIAGIVMTIVDATDNEQRNKYPEIFAVIGPVLIVLAVIILVSGITLSTPVMSRALHHCFSFDDPESFCRVHCPRFSHFLKPDTAVLINQAGMKALKVEPGKSALRRQPAAPPDQENHIITKGGSEDVEAQYNVQNPSEVGTISCDVDAERKLVNNNSHGRSRLGSKGVRFSESDDGDAVREARAPSVSSSSDHNGSMLSLRHCKVHPKNGIWWTDSVNPQPNEMSESEGHLTTEL